MVTLEALTTVTVKAGCLIEVLALVGGYFAATYSTPIHLGVFEVHFDCTFSDLVVTFCGRREGNLVFWSKVNFSLQAQRSGFPSMCRFPGRRSTLDMVVVQRASCPLDMWLIFRNRKKSRAKAAFWHLEVLCGP